MTHSFSWTSPDSIDYECELEVYEGCRGSYEGGMQMEPDEPPSAELVSACVDGVEKVHELTDEQVTAIEVAFLSQDFDESESFDYIDSQED